MVIVLLVAGTTAGCGGNAAPVIVTLPPSATFTPGPPTSIPAAAVPSPTPLPAPASTTAPGTPGPTPTFPLAPTATLAPQVLTATLAPTLAGLSVEYFTTDTASVTPGDNVTLYWSVRGADRARIYRLDQDNERIFRWDVVGAGKITVATRAEDRDAARFLLTAEANGASIEQPLMIPLECPELWFFDPAPEACAAGDPQISNEAEQTFERGRMVWVEAQDRIYVIFEDGGSPGWTQFPDEFEEGDPALDESLVPRPNLQQPVRGFGLVWRSNDRVRERVGWATSPEVPFEGMVQATSAQPESATLYLRLRDGGILALDARTEEWEVVPPPPAAEGSPGSP